MNAPLGILSSRLASEHSIAVVIPTYNRASALISCLEHLERQTWKDFEVVVVDDGSQDETPQRIQEYQKRTSLHMRFVRQQNGGPARARNAAISLVRSPLILMIGDDIFATPQFVETHLHLHRQRPELQVAGLGLTRWEEQTQRVTPFMRFLEEGIQFSYPDLTAGKNPTSAHFYTSNLSVKTELLRRNPFCERFPKASLEDLELGLRIARREGLDIVFIPGALAYHFHPTTFIQACQRMRHAGWAAHLMHEIWPDSYSHPAGRTAVRRMVRRALAPPPILRVATRFTAVLSRFCSAKGLFRAVLGTHFFLGYRDRDLQSGRTGGPDHSGTESRCMQGPARKRHLSEAAEKETRSKRSTTSMTRILHIITGLGTGGAEMMLLKPLTVNHGSRCQAVISLKDGGAIGARIRVLGVPVYSLGLQRGTLNPFRALPIISIARRFNPQVTQGWMYTAISWQVLLELP